MQSERDDENQRQLLFADDAELQFLLEWQQQRYHHLQTLSLSLLGALATIFAILATLFSATGFLSLPSLPQGEWFGPVVRGSRFSVIPTAILYTAGILHLIVGVIFLIIVARNAIRKIFGVAFGPQLYPRLSDSIIISGEPSLLGDNENMKQTHEEIYHAVNKNKRLLNQAQYDFRGSAIRSVGWFALALVLYQMYISIANTNTGNIFYLNLSLTAGPIIGLIQIAMGKQNSIIRNNELLGITEEGLGNPSPMDFEQYEKILAILLTIFVVISVVASVVDILL